MAKKDLRAQMDAARAAAAFIGAAQEVESRTADREEAEAAGDRAPVARADVAGAPAAGAAEEAPAGSRAAAAGASAPRVTGDGLPLADGATDAASVGTKDAPRAKRSARSAKGAASDGTTGTARDFLSEEAAAPSAEELLGSSQAAGAGGAQDAAARGTAPAAEAPEGAAGRGATTASRSKATRTRKPRKKAEAAAEAEEGEGANARMTAQVLVPMTAEQREHADLLAQVMKVTRAEVMRQALDEYWDNHKADLQAAVAAYEQLIRKLMK